MTGTLPDAVRIARCGVTAFRVTADTGDAEKDWRIAHHLARSYARRPQTPVLYSIPTYESVLLEFDPARIDPDKLALDVRATLDCLDFGAPVTSHPRHFVIPVVYGGEWGPDLSAVSEMLGIPDTDIIARHHARPYVIRCLGAPGGSPMLDAPRFPGLIPRLTSPRATVPAGVVSLAGRQATVAPTSAPGGWQLIGRTPLRLFDATADPVVPYQPGDVVEFRPIDPDEYDGLVGQPLRAQEDQ